MCTDISVLLAFEEGTQIIYSGYELKLIFHSVIENYNTHQIAPVKIEVTNLYKTLYFDIETISDFAIGNITQDEMFERIACECMVRNIDDIKTDSNVDIDSNSLWMVQSGFAILIDRDQDIRVPYDTVHFKII